MGTQTRFDKDEAIIAFDQQTVADKESAIPKVAAAADEWTRQRTHRAAIEVMDLGRCHQRMLSHRTPAREGETWLRGS